MTPKQFNEYQRQAEVIENHKKWKEEKQKDLIQFSDDEIYDMAYDYLHPMIRKEFINIFMDGMKLYRDKLKERQ